jgi:hypothetical protein
MIKGLLGFECCQDCHWGQQCDGDEPCEFFDPLSDELIEMRSAAIHDEELTTYRDIWYKYCQMK